MRARNNFLLSLFNIGDTLEEDVPSQELMDELAEEFFSYPSVIQRGIRRHCQRVREICQELENRLGSEE